MITLTLKTAIRIAFVFVWFFNFFVTRFKPGKNNFDICLVLFASQVFRSDEVNSFAICVAPCAGV